MSLSDFQIHEIDCRLNPEERRKIRQMAESIYLSSPSDSNLKISITKTAAGFDAGARMVSTSGVHHDHFYHVDPVEAMRGLRDAMNIHIVYWKKTRFQDENRAS